MQLSLVAARTTAGPRRRQNKDWFLADPRGNLFVVCDGVGRGELGKLAARLGVWVIARELREMGVLRRPDLPVEQAGEALRGAMTKAHQRIQRESRRRCLRRPMGSTAVAALLLEGRAVIAHVGDSRAYLLGRGGCRRLTCDHTVADMLADLGAIDRSCVERHPLRRALSRQLGQSSGLEPDVGVHDLACGDRLLLCSDGLNAGLTDADLQRLGRACGELGHVAGLLVRAAQRGGSRDDVTVVVAEQPPAAESARADWLRQDLQQRSA